LDVPKETISLKFLLTLTQLTAAFITWNPCLESAKRRALTYTSSSQSPPRKSCSIYTIPFCVAVCLYLLRQWRDSVTPDGLCSYERKTQCCVDLEAGLVSWIYQ